MLTLFVEFSTAAKKKTEKRINKVRQILKIMFEQMGNSRCWIILLPIRIDVY